MSQQISPQKILAKPQTRNYKKNTFDHELEIFSAYENPGKIIFTDPSFTLQNQKKNRKNQTKLTNPIYNLDEEIKAHSKAMLEQNFSTGFTPNSKQTEEDFDSDDIGEGGSIDKNYKNTCKVLIKKTPNLADSDAISQFTELSKNVKYVDGGVGVVECNSFNRLFNEKKSELDSSGGGTLKKNRIKSPFFPMLLIQTNNQKICPGNSKFSAFLNSLSKDLK